MYKGHHFENWKQNHVTLLCSSNVLPTEADAAVYWERTYTVDKSIPLANLIMPQVLPPQRASPSCVIAAIAMLALNTWSIYAAKGSAVQR